MRNIVCNIREKYVKWLLLLFIPFTILTFMWEPDSAPGKILHTGKFLLMGLLYLLYIREQKWYTHLFVIAATLSMGISVLKHGSTGTVLLILTLFFAFCTLPKVDLPLRNLRSLFLFLGISTGFVLVFSIITNYKHGLTAFFYHGFYNPNTMGMLFLSTFFYWVSYLQLCHDEKITISEVLLIIVFAVFFIMSGCRSVILALGVFILCYALRKSKYRTAFYYVIATFSIVVCFVIIMITNHATDASGLINLEILGKKVLSGREKIWEVIFTGIKSSPLYGLPIEYLFERTGLSSAHNVFMGIIFSVGLIPSFTYIKLLFSPKDLFSQENLSKQSWTINQTCFIASIVIATFECAYTDNRLNFLFLPLLLGTKEAIHSEAFVGSETKVCQRTCNMFSFVKQLFTPDKKSLVTILLTSIIFLSVLAEPFALKLTRKALPQKVDQAYLDQIGYGNNQINVLASYKGYNEQSYGILWNWDDNAYSIIGDAEDFTFKDLYHSVNTLPDWAVPGKQYHVIYEADSAKFRIYYYSPEGLWINLVYTTQSVDFTIPNNALGLIVRIELSAGDSAFEKVMPIIYALEDEPNEMKDKRIVYPTLMDHHFFDEAAINQATTTNLIGNKTYPSTEYRGIVWEWNGDTYNVRGTASDFSFFDFYNSSSTLPEWAIPGKKYQILYSAESVRFRIYYYSPEGTWPELVTTKTSTSFTLPEEAQGLIIRIELDPGQSALESVMPWIIPVGKM